MTGPEHYREAERLLEFAAFEDGSISFDPPEAAALEAAMVHALLALAAAALPAPLKPAPDTSWLNRTHGHVDAS